MDQRNHIDNRRITALLSEFVEGDAGNRIAVDTALRPDLVGLKLFDAPLVRFGAADDPLFEAFKQPEAVGPGFMAPCEWLEGAETVISFFLPFSERVKRGNAAAPTGTPSDEWLHGRIEGQDFIVAACRHLLEAIEGLGGHAVCPFIDERYTETYFRPDDPDPSHSFRSNWSERHVGYACGMGTFSLSKGLITEAGVAGRLGSVITDLRFESSARPYSDLYEYCIDCGACVTRCPVEAISHAKGKEHLPCALKLQSTRQEGSRYYGCGKCQVGVPCESGIPSKGTH